MTTTPTPTPYEREQFALIREWLAEAPGPAARATGKSRSPTAGAVQGALPSAALKLALDAVHSAALRLRDRRSVLRCAGVDDLAALRDGELETCDRLAQGVARRAVAMAGSSGAAFGVVGVYGLIADVPLLLIQALRGIHRIGLCYGEDCEGPLERRLPVAVFALASAASETEKRAALRAVVDEAQRHAAPWRAGVERAAQRQFAKDAAVFSINNAARSLVRNLGWRKAAGALPVTGAVIGGSVNAWYLRDVTRAARHVFQLRWLTRKYGERLELPALPAAEV